MTHHSSFTRRRKRRRGFVFVFSFTKVFNLNLQENYLNLFNFFDCVFVECMIFKEPLFLFRFSLTKVCIAVNLFNLNAFSLNYYFLQIGLICPSWLSTKVVILTTCFLTKISIFFDCDSCILHYLHKLFIFTNILFHKIISMNSFLSHKNTYFSICLPCIFFHKTSAFHKRMYSYGFSQN